jgi:hypothetical protein
MLRNLLAPLLTAPLLVALLVPVIDHRAAAQEKPGTDVDLRGIKALHVTLSPISASSLDCGLRGSDVVAEARARLVAGGLPDTSGAEELAIVTVMSSHDATTGTCSSSIMLGAYARASFVDKRVGWIRTGYVVLWQSGVIVMSGATDHLDTVRQAVDRLTDALLDAWHRDNTAP